MTTTDTIGLALLAWSTGFVLAAIALYAWTHTIGAWLHRRYVAKRVKNLRVYFAPTIVTPHDQ